MFGLVINSNICPNPHMFGLVINSNICPNPNIAVIAMKRVGRGVHKFAGPVFKFAGF
jgi:hypothetical protein